MDDIDIMKFSRRIVRSALVGTALGVAFLFMASIFVPGRSQADSDALPGVPDPLSAESMEAMEPLGRIEGKLYTVEVFATPSGPLFTVFDRHGNELAPLLTPAQVAERFPDLPLTDAHADVPIKIMGTDIGGGH
jgi:hypothetical protein